MVDLRDDSTLKRTIYAKKNSSFSEVPAFPLLSTHLEAALNGNNFYLFRFFQEPYEKKILTINLRKNEHCTAPGI